MPSSRAISPSLPKYEGAFTTPTEEMRLAFPAGTPTANPSYRFLDICHCNMEADAATKISQAFQSASLKKSPQGKNGALFVVGEPDQKILAVFKSKSREIGLNNCPKSIKEGIIRGEGVFSNYLSGLFIEDCLNALGIPAEEINIPPSMWVSVNYKTESANLFDFEETSQISSIYSEGSFHEFIENCFNFTEASKRDIEGLSVRAIQTYTLACLLLVNADGNKGNILLKRNESGKTTLIPIDFLALPTAGDSSVELPFLSHPFILSALKEPLCPEIKASIFSLGIDFLKNHLEELKRNQVEDASSFSDAKILVHEIALSLVQEGIKNELSLVDLCGLFIDFCIEAPDNAVSTIYQKCKHCPSKHTILNLCSTLVQFYKTALESSSKNIEDPILNYSRVKENQLTAYKMALTLFK